MSAAELAQENYSQHLNHPVFQIVRKLTANGGLQAYVIGGFVRDLLLRRPNKDIDIVVAGSGIDLAHQVAESIGDHTPVTVFKNFGTAMIRVDDYEIEFVGARKESYRRNSRKPVVEDGSLEDDQNRRDFTINAMAISLNDGTFGTLNDPFNGCRDIEDQIIRTPLDPTITFSDDPLRMMRAIRFAAQLNYVIEPSSLNAIKQMAERIKIVSAERITDEINKIMMSERPSVGFRLMDQTGLMALIIPQLHQLHGVDSIAGKAHKDNFFHSLKVLDNVAEKSDDLWLRWAALLHDLGKPLVKRFDQVAGWTFHNHEFIGAKQIPALFRQLKLPLNEKMAYVKKIVGLHHRPVSLSKEEVTDSAVRRLLFDAGDDIDDLMTLCEADITSKNADKVNQYLGNFRLVRQKLADLEEADRIRNWQPPITGEVIMSTFHIGPGREVGVIKNAIREAILDGEIKNDYDEAFAFMLKKGLGLGLSSR